MALIPCSDISPADWIATSTRPWEALASFGPHGFPEHARLRFLPDPAYPGQSEGDAETAEDAPTETDLLRTALTTLASHTATPDECYFALWEGWGSELFGGDGAWFVDGETHAVTKGPQSAPAFPISVMNHPKVEIPNRSYYLFRGSIQDFGNWGAAELWPGQPRFSMPNPAFIWPADHAWCIANDVDPHWAGIAARAKAIEQLLTTPSLDLVRTDPGEEHPYYR
ncbi:hypothetical protein [Paeniglutamicibacter sp. NPDC091659]|uniref:hypothetical protein n=1 Tax=Paeniglutamicibacter sp. NPDC091659 TaxID=3364389 RepID=UPI00382B5E2E